MPKRRPAPIDPGTLDAARSAFISAMTAHYGAQINDPPRTQHHQRVFDAAMLRAAKALLAAPEVPVYADPYDHNPTLVRTTFKHCREYQIWRTREGRHFSTTKVPGKGYARIKKDGHFACPQIDPERLAISANLRGPTYSTVYRAIDAIRKPMIPPRHWREQTKNID